MKLVESRLSVVSVSAQLHCLGDSRPELRIHGEESAKIRIDERQRMEFDDNILSTAAMSASCN